MVFSSVFFELYYAKSNCQFPMYLVDLCFSLEDLLANTVSAICPFAVNKQLNDKERVAAALENPNLRQLVDECLYSNEL